jgi:aspartate racemase
MSAERRLPALLAAWQAQSGDVAIVGELLAESRGTMKLLGLIGGMSWESTAVYYRLFNEGARKRHGGLHSAPLLLWSFDFDEIARRQAECRWDVLTKLTVEAGHKLCAAGAQALIICSNTMHRVAPALASTLPIPILHIVEATGAALRSSQCRRPILMGTRFTMEQSFYVERLTEAGIHPIIPDEPSRTVIHQIIYEELCRGIFRSESKLAYLTIIDQLRHQGADGVIFGCTEIGLLLRPADIDLPVFDTTEIHVEAALDLACS